jgi:hypothetical protein
MEGNPMKRNVTATMLILAFFMPSLASAAPLASDKPIALGADIGTIAAGALMGAVTGSLSADLPLSRAWSLNLAPSGYWASINGTSMLQLNMEGTVRFCLMSLFVKDASRQVNWGLFAACGAATAWERIETASALNVLSAGPVLRAGYRLVLGDHGIFLEPSLGWMALYGVQFSSGGVFPTLNTGATLGMILGYRF